MFKYVAADEENNKTLAEIIRDKRGHADTVIPNAVKHHEVVEHINVNAMTSLVLFQAMFGLLKARKLMQKFIPISSAAGSLSAAAPFGLIVYGGSKVLLNYITRRIHFENEWLGAFLHDSENGFLIPSCPWKSYSRSPHVVRTNLYEQGREMDPTHTFKKVSIDEVTKPNDATVLLVDIVENATRENEGGQFINIDGSRLPW
ncbi:unnamed protein product [Cyclocybe aegerita]|uniref:Uncharacterized protein n=1 Tax=Cyclocybe aegerita TaxID=1973307 RepID=A0A8S0XS05_CYCAE|nr:unnamed protein product [Cyclocybe aegerita]